MFKKSISLIVLSFCIWFMLSNVCYAIQILTKEAALEKVFGRGVQIVTENKELTAAQLSKIKERLGGDLISIQKGSKSKEVEIKANIDFYFAVKNGKKTGVAIIDEEPGKWGTVEFIVALDLEGRVTRVEVLSHQEKRGQPITRHSFLSQFEGKTSKNSLQVDKDITGVSGATISSNCATFAVKKCIILYEEVYLR